MLKTLARYNKLWIALAGLVANGLLATIDANNVWYPVVSLIAAALVGGVPNAKTSPVSAITDVKKGTTT